jgi:hypothetical protein
MDKQESLFPDNVPAGSALVVDKLYQSGRSGHSGDDVLSKLIGVSNQGGFRYLGSPDALKLVVVTSTFDDADWPDSVDTESGVFTYFGDNKTPGQDLHTTPRRGNLLLKNIFSCIHGDPPQREKTPPILVFRNTGYYRDVVFLGLAVPGVEGLSSANDLVAIWKTKEGRRFQNYQAHFTILDIPSVSPHWLGDIKSGNPLSQNCPKPWKKWVETGTYQPLASARTVEIRNKTEQLPDDAAGKALIRQIYSRFSANPFEFERFAAELVRSMDVNFVSMDVTRASRDGGRDAIGKYRIGSATSGILIDCAVEAKCYALNNAVGVRELSRLISRLRHRHFGVLVTTSYLHEQAYKEIKEDGHPIIVISARDIVTILRRTNRTDFGKLQPHTG